VTSWIRRLLGRRDPSDPEQQLKQLREDLRREPSEFALDTLRPVLIPSPILATGTWVGPYHRNKRGDAFGDSGGVISGV
jgi:hypothetical protein